MPKYLYLDSNGQKCGPINDEQLKVLAARGIITPETPLATAAGHKGKAGQIPGLQFGSAAPSPGRVLKLLVRQATPLKL